MMDEKSIRRQTGIILDAYTELVGGCGPVSVRDFIRFRREAVRELAETGVCSPAGPFTAPASEPVKADIYTGNAGPESVPEHPARTPVTEPMGRSPVPEPAPAVPVVPSGPAEQPKAPAQHKKKTKYEILRDLNDPWN